MDPTNRGSEAFHDDEQSSAGVPRKRRPPREPAQADAAPGGQGPVRVVRLVSGDYLLTVNPVDGSEIEPCPPGSLPARPERHGPEQRAELRRAAAPPPPARQAGPQLPLLHREEERERLGRLLSRGRSVRLTGPSGSGRSVLLDAVAEDCAGLAPDGVVRLSGYRRTPGDLLHELFAAVHHAPLHRPDRAGLMAAVQNIGAVVVLDDLEFGGVALDELLDATPECAFLLSATPDVPAPSADSHVEEVFLGGLGRTGCLELLERAVDRALTDEEADWVADLWFESEGLPLRFVQAGALLRLGATAGTTATDAFDAFGERSADKEGTEGTDGESPAPLPTLAQAAAPATLLAAALGEAARETLRFAVALGGELPHQAHLPALVGDTHADAAVGELLACGLITPVAGHYRLAAGVADQLIAGYGEEWARQAAATAHTAAQHYAWWAGHPSVSPERIAVEADAILAALAALTGEEDSGHRAAAVLLARTAAPAFAAALHWGAWERSLRHGQEAARIAGEVGEEAYFHHELGVLALCTGNLDRARSELEASIGLRGVLADKRGTVAGRRALALVADRSGLALGARALPGSTPARPGGAIPPLPPPRTGVDGRLADGRTSAGEEIPDARSEQSAAPPAKAKVAATAAGEDTTAIIGRAVPGGAGAVAAAAVPPVPKAAPGAPRPAGARKGSWAQKLMSGGNRRNLLAAGAGALLAAVLGTVVTLGAASGGDAPPTGPVKPGQSASQQDGDGGLSADEPAAGEPGAPQVPARRGRQGEKKGDWGDGSASPRPSGSASSSADPEPSASSSRTPTGEPSSGASTKTPGGDGTKTPPVDPTPSKSQGGGDKTPTEKPSEPSKEPSKPSQPTAGGTNSASGPAPGGKPTAGKPTGGTPVA
ncbi:ATP-binding protein [Streptomyces sp. NPDC001678]|uniref:ATP-binding protein n=1 Tax=Streptomyces sp. NPDC001678 TaxID=3364599 RepID=UPI0036C02D65